MRNGAIFRTGEVAALCNVAPRTVAQWIDKGLLTGFRLPGSWDRRVLREDLVRFLAAYGIPNLLEEGGRHKILLIGSEQLFAGRVQELLPEDEGFEVHHAASGFEGGLAANSHPGIVIIDLGMGRSEGLQIAQDLRRNPAHEAVMIVGLAGEDEAAPEQLTGFGFNEIWKKPFDVALLAERIRTLAGAVQCPVVARRPSTRISPMTIANLQRGRSGRVVKAKEQR